MWQVENREVADAFGLDIAEMTDGGEDEIEYIKAFNDELQRQVYLSMEEKKKRSSDG